MTQILMIQGAGNNESAWARMSSARGRAVLRVLHNQSFCEVWERGQLVLHDLPRIEPRANRWNILFLDLLTLMRMVKLAIDLRRKHGRFDVAIGASTYYGLTVLMMKKLGWSRTAVSFLQDYFPPRGSFLARMWRNYHKNLSAFVAKRADEVWRVSTRIPTAEVNPKNFVIPVYIDDNHVGPENRTDIAYVGGPLDDHCLPWLFQVAKKHCLRLHIVGANPYLDTIRHLAPDNAIFYGIEHDKHKLAEIMGKCFCGYAVYRDTSPTNYAWYGVPSKIYGYLANNLPVVTTDICEWSHNVADHSLGQLVEPTIDNVEAAILGIRSNFQKYYDAINVFRTQWNAGVETFLEERLAELVGSQGDRGRRSEVGSRRSEVGGQRSGGGRLKAES